MQLDRYIPDLSAAELVETINGLRYAKRCTEWLVCRYLADLAENDAFRSVSPSAGDIRLFAKQRFDFSPKLCRERIRIGRALRHLPNIEEAFLTGELSYSRVREITRVADPTSELYWLESARRLPISALEKRVAEQSSTEKPPERRRAPRRWASPEVIEVKMFVAPEIWAQLDRAMGCVRAAADRDLTDAEALEAIARAAIDDHLEAEPTEEKTAGTQEAPEVTPPCQEREPNATNDVPPDSRDSESPAFAPDSSEAKILEVMGDRGGWPAERLLKETGMEVPKLQVALTKLQLANAIRVQGFRYSPVPKKRPSKCPSWGTPPATKRRALPKSIRLGVS